MEETVMTPTRRPARRRKTKLQRFKEAYLPYLILMSAVVLVIILIIGALIRNAKDAQQSQDQPDTIHATIVEVVPL